MRIRNSLSATAVLALALASDAWAGIARERHAPVDERALKNLPTVGTHTNAPNNTVSYSNTIAGGPEWARPFADCTGLSGLGPVRYHVQPFYVSAAGAYDVTSVQDGSWDGYIFIYQGAFDPNNPNTNCVVGNDDGTAGIGTSEILGEALAPSTQYLVVMTAFELGEEGTFTNTITGPGTVTLGALGGTADLSITKVAPEGVVIGDVTEFTLTAANAGPDPATAVVVSDAIPGVLSYVSNNCGATAVGNNLTWNIGGMASGGSATCSVITQLSSTAGCQVVTNTATISSTNFDPSTANNSSTFANAPEQIADPSFEDGSPNGFWTEASTNFGTPLCTIADCGTGTGTGPHTGDWWSWFGGIAAAETGSMTQSVTIPTGATTLTFWLEAPVCANTTDFLELRIDGNTVWTVNGTSPLCNTVGYTQQSVNIAAYANGAAHSIQFFSTISGSPSGSNFFVDDVSLAVPTCTVDIPSVIEVPTLDPIGLAALALGLAGLGFALLRRRAA